MLILATPLLSRDSMRRRDDHQRAALIKRLSAGQGAHSGGTTPFLKMKQP